MTPADILAADHTLQPRGWRSAPLPWDQVTQVQATRLASLADEVGLVLQMGAQTLYVRETDPGFDALAAHLGLSARWGANWITRAEAGEALTLLR